MNKELLVSNQVDVNKALEFWGDMESYNANLKEYFNSLLSKLNELNGYKVNKDVNNYAILAHSMKSEAKYFGFMKEADVFLAHELKGKEGNLDYINEHFDDLKKTILRINSLLSEYFGVSKEKFNILAVDDSQIVLNFISESIKDKYNVIKAFNGLEAIKKLEEYNVYAILLDLNMPSANGFEVLNYLKEHGLIDRIPVVIITGDDTVETINKAFSFPILDVLNKPFTPENMQRILDSIASFYERKAKEII